MHKLLKNKNGEKAMLLGNEAIVRAALESGVQFVATYPGTPASEIGNNFFALQKELKENPRFHFEFSTNEKTAMEAAIGANFSGLKTLVAMKNFGLNVALEPLLPLAYTGTAAPMVIYVADDPSCHSSAQSEENSRPFSVLAHLPMLEPADVRDCYDFIIEGFKISEKFGLPVILRATTRVAHQRAQVALGDLDLSKKINLQGKFVKNKQKFVTMMPRLHEMKQEMLARLEKVQSYLEGSGINRVEGIVRGKKQPLGIITSGVSYLHAKEAMGLLKVDLPVLKIGSFHPLPKKKIAAFIKPLKKVLVLEELEPYLRHRIDRLAKEVNCKLEIYGKGLVSYIGEMKPEIAANAVAKFTGKNYKMPKFAPKFVLPARPPQLCPGCPYWLVFAAAKKAVDEDKVVFGGDIGCYMIGALPPHNLYDYMFCMGSSIGIAHGIKKANPDQKVIAFIGDGTFFHSGIEGLLNAVYNKSNPLVIILNNEITGMTGHQPHPDAIGVENRIPIEKMVLACGIKEQNLKIIDQGNSQEFIAAVQEFIQNPEPSVIIARRPCKFVAPKG